MAEIKIIVSGPVGCGKSAILGEIEILMRALGVPVRYEDAAAAQSEKNMTHADWTEALGMYKPSVILVEDMPWIRDASAQQDEREAVGHAVDVLETLTLWGAEEWSEQFERNPPIVAIVAPLLAALPKVSCRDAYEAEFFTGMSDPSEWSKETKECTELLFRMFERGWRSRAAQQVQADAGAVADAARYRWLRDSSCGPYLSKKREAAFKALTRGEWWEDIDAAIDAAMSREQSQGSNK